MSTISGFHSHIYFDVQNRADADALRVKLGETFGTNLRHWGKLIDRPIGPHPLPMFEIDFFQEQFTEIVTYLMQNHGELSVLIHPETGDDLKDHTIHALWLGKQLELNLDVL